MLKEKIQLVRNTSKSVREFNQLLKNDNQFLCDLYKTTFFLVNGASMKERIWCVENDIYEYPNICPTCSKVITKWWDKIGYIKWCSRRCSSNDPDVKSKIIASVKKTAAKKSKDEKLSILNKRKLTCLERYGVENVYQSEEVKEKIKETNLERYGVEIPTQNKEIMKKIKQTNLERYGVEIPIQNKEIMKKVEKTNLKKYGVKVPAQNSEVFNKMTQTNLKKYGVENVFQSEEVKEKIKQTNLEKYGVEYPLQSKIIHEKLKQTNIKKYGCEYPLQNAEVHNRILKSGYQAKKYLMPSGKIIYTQGYENIVIDQLLLDYKEEDIIVDNKEIELNIGKLLYFWNGKYRRYYPDIYIKSKNLIIEVKSTYTFNADYSKNIAKKEVCINKGINFKFEILDSIKNKFL